MGKALVKKPAAKGRRPVGKRAAAKKPPKKTRSGEPKCPQGRKRHLTQLRTRTLRSAWPEEEGRKWTWHMQIYSWRSCSACHKKKRPDDGRRRNRWSTPKAAKFEGVHKFYLWEPPPEVAVAPAPLPPRPPREGWEGFQRIPKPSCSPGASSWLWSKWWHVTSGLGKLCAYAPKSCTHLESGCNNV